MRLQPCLQTLDLTDLHSDLSRSLQERPSVVLWALVVGILLAALSLAAADHLRLMKSVIESLLHPSRSFHSPLLEGVAVRESVVGACDPVALDWYLLAVFAHLAASVGLVDLGGLVAVANLGRVCLASTAFDAHRYAARYSVPASVLVTP